MLNIRLAVLPIAALYAVMAPFSISYADTDEELVNLYEALSSGLAYSAAGFCGDATKASQLEGASASCVETYTHYFNTCKGYDPQAYGEGQRVPAPADALDILVPVGMLEVVRQSLENCLVTEFQAN